MTNVFQPLPRTKCGIECKYWTHDMDSSYCQHPEAMKVSWAGLSEDAVSRARLCFHGNDSEPARDELFEPRKPDVETCKHDYSSDGTFSGGCVNMVCRHCGDEYERDVS